MLAQDQLQPQALFPSIGTAQRFQPKTETAPAQSALAHIYAPPQAEDAPTQSYAIAPETLKKFRRGYGEEAELVAQQLRGIVVTSGEGVLRQAQMLSKLKSRLNRKEWGVWLKEVLGWFGKEVAPYLQIAKTFGKFDPAVFRELEPFTLLKLRTKKYTPLVERLQEELVVTSELIQNFISEVIPKPSRRKKAAPNYGEAVLKQRVNPEDGTFYFTLNANLSDKPGSWLEEKLENCTVGQVLEQAAALEKQVEERDNDIRLGIQGEIDQRVRERVEMAEFALKQEIADLRAQLQGTAKARVVGEEALATTNTTDNGTSDAVRAVAASTTVGEFAITTTNTLGDEASAEVKAVAASTTVGEFAVATLRATDEEASAEAQAVAAAFPALAQEAEGSESNDEIADATVHQSPEPEAVEEPVAHVPVHQVAQLSEASEPYVEVTTAAAQDAVAPIEPTSIPSAESQLIITLPWKQINQLRAAEKYIHEIESHIKKINSDLTTPRLEKIVENQLRDALRNRQKLRSNKIAQIIDVADQNGIIADYEALQNSGRVVLATEYASALVKQSKSWSDVAMVVGSDRNQLLRAVKHWGIEEKRLLVELLSSHLETEANALEQIDWIPKNLLSKVFSNFTFRLHKIKQSDNLVDEPELEYLQGCKFVSVQHLGDHQEQWLFEFEGKNISVAGRDGFEIEKF